MKAAPWSGKTLMMLTSKPGVTYTYDADGNTRSKTDASGTTSYGWDFENRLTSVTLPGTAGTVSFKYDPFGRRIEKSSATGTTNYAYDGDNIVEELSTAGTSAARYTQGLGIDEPLVRQTSTSTVYYEADGLGSITSLTTAAGAVTMTYSYDSFGVSTGTTGSETNPYRYTGREVDARTALHYYRARYYAPNVGRFVSEDPIRWWAGQKSFYPYVANSPANYLDPFGLRIVVLGNMSDYQQAVAYLNRDTGMARVIHDLDNSSTTYTVIMNNDNDDHYVPSTHEIHWHPHSALRCTSSGRQSPALGLGHEMAHADGGFWSRLLVYIPWPGYDDLEERRVIAGPETNAARPFGQSLRSFDADIEVIMRLRPVIYCIMMLIGGCAEGNQVKADSQTGSEVDGLVAKLAKGEIGRVEVLQIPPEVLTRTRITPEMLERQFDYKFTIHDVRGGAYRKGLLEAMRSVEVGPRSEMPDLRWGIVFYDVHDMRVGALYFDKTGSRGAVDNAPVSFRGDFFKWLKDSFARCFR